MGGQNLTFLTRVEAMNLKTKESWHRNGGRGMNPIRFPCHHSPAGSWEGSTVLEPRIAAMNRVVLEVQALSEIS
jgi:hypothetical protein